MVATNAAIEIAARIEAAVRADLQDALLFVQLLSEVPGRKLEGSEQRRVAAQHAVARALGKPIVQWHSPKTELQHIACATHRALINGPAMFAKSFGSP